MKIVILKIPIGIGGAEVSLNEMAEELQSLGHEVFTYYDFGDSKNIIEFNKFGLIKERLGIDVKKYSEEECIFKLHQADLVIMIHRNFYSKQLAQACNKVPTKIVYVPGKNKHHVAGTGTAEDSTPIIQNINYYIFNSQHTMGLYLQDFNDIKSKFKHIHPPMNTSRYTIQNLYDKSKLNVSMFGRLIPSKRPILAIDMLKKQNDFKLNFIGGGQLSADIEQKIKKEKLNFVKITGMLNNPFDDLQRSSVVMHLCDHESMSRALRESMILRVPIIAINRAGNRELLKNLPSLLFEENTFHKTLLKFKSSDFREKMAGDCLREIKKTELDAKLNFSTFIKSL